MKNEEVRCGHCQELCLKHPAKNCKYDYRPIYSMGKLVGFEAIKQECLEP